MFHNHLVFRRNLFADVPFSGFNIFLQILNDLIRNIDCFIFILARYLLLYYSACWADND